MNEEVYSFKSYMFQYGFNTLIVKDDLEVGFNLIPFVLEPDCIEMVQNQTVLQKLK